MDGLEVKEIFDKQDLRTFYFDFFKDFRDYLSEYIRETVVELTIAEIPVSGTLKLFDGYTQGKVRIKNQGEVSCFVTTGIQGGYRLDPNESIEFFVNNSVSVVTLSGTTVVGFVKC